MSKKIETGQSRFSDADWYGKSYTAIIGGVGGIGSWTALFLTKLGVNLVLYDMDKVENVNTGSQFYGRKDINDLKVNATLNNVRMFDSGTTSITPKHKYVEASMRGPIMLACFDNMAARKLMYENWKKVEDPNKIFIDGRMLAEQFEIHFVLPGREEEYEKSMFEDSEVPPVPCSYKSTVHFGAGIAYEMIKGLTNHLANIALEDTIKEVPRSLSVYGDTFLNEIKYA